MAATYSSNARRIIGMVQQWQLLLAPQGDAHTVTVTLADVEAVLATLEQTFGRSATLETIIQQLVREDLRDQRERRRRVSPSQQASVAVA